MLAMMARVHPTQQQRDGSTHEAILAATKSLPTPGQPCGKQKAVSRRNLEHEQTALNCWQQPWLQNLVMCLRLSKADAPLSKLDIDFGQDALAMGSASQRGQVWADGVHQLQV